MECEKQGQRSACKNDETNLVHQTEFIPGWLAKHRDYAHRHVNETPILDSYASTCSGKHARIITFQAWRFAMRRACFLFLVVFGIPASSFGQAASSDSQTLQALLTEVRGLRQELRISLARTQSAQILLSRLQTQQAVVTRASERLTDARAKLTDAQTHQKDVRNNLKRFEDALSDEQNPAQQKELRDRSKSPKPNSKTRRT
jgi:hypothetical protein